jgi:glycerol-3-phosphate acyltransferase PlsY
MGDPALLALAALGGYLLGSVPFGLVLTRLAGEGDIRAIGSGNIGATNVLRTGRRGLALATLLLDGGKGAAAVGLAAALIGPAAMPVAGFAAVLGHNFPVWLKFRGGKGVATTFGTLLALSWPVGAATCATWIVAAVLFRISSLSALVALILSPAFAVFLPPGARPEIVAAVAGLAALGVLRHRANIARLLKGEEPRIGKK